MMGIVKYSLVVPIYNNELNIKPLFNEVENFEKRYGNEFELILVVDGSPDNSYDEIIKCSSLVNFKISVANLSRNFGSFSAIRTGMELANGKYVAVMAADLQEPPELIIEIFDMLSLNTSDIVFGERVKRYDPYAKKILSNLFWRGYKRFVVPDLPIGGVDIFGCTKQVADTIIRMDEAHSSLITQLFWVGYRRSFIPYVRRERKIGKSAWSFKKRIEYMLDSVFSFTDIPIRMIMRLGVFGLIFTLLFSLLVAISKLFGLINVPGYSGLMLVTLFLFSLMLIIQGIIGNYVWRIYENTKNRPLSIVRTVEKFNRVNENEEDCHN